jgi:dienelactone hydrolase
MMSQVTVRSVVYQIDGQSYESRLAFDASQKNPLPGLLMAPNWMGVSAGAEEIAKSVAAKGYVVLIVEWR